MPDLTAGQMRRRLAAELEQQGWSYDANVAAEIVAAAERAGRVEPKELARLVPSTYLDQNRTDRAAVERAIARAIGGGVPVSDPTRERLTINNTAYNVTLSGSSRIGTANIGPGTQIVVKIGADKDTVLDGIAALVHSGIEGDWNADAAAALAEMIADRDDIAVGDVQETTARVLTESKPTQSRTRDLLEKIGASGLGGALANGISAGAGEVLQQLPM
jgi:hypothetical protein